MGLSLFYFLLSILLATVALYRGKTLRLFRRYPLLFTYVVVGNSIHGIRLLSEWYWGANTWPYFWIYYSTSVPGYALQILILLGLYYLYDRPRLSRDWGILASLPIFIFIAFTFGTGWHYLLRVDHVALFFTAYIAYRVVVRAFRQPHVAIGKNLGALLAAIFFPTALQALNQAAYLSQTGFWPRIFFAYGIEFTNVAAWAILAYGLREFDPPRFIGGGPFDAKEARGQMRRLILSLWGMSKNDDHRSDKRADSALAPDGPAGLH